MKAIKDLEEGTIFIVGDNDIEKGLARDTYSSYGQPVDSYEAGDWCFPQPDFRVKAKKEAENQLGKIDWDKFVVFDIDDTHVEVDAYETDDEKLAKKIQGIMNDWAKENFKEEEATYLNYWDGHNYQSIVFEQGADINDSWEILDDDEAQEYIDIYNKASFGDWKEGIRTDVVDGYLVSQSRWEGDWWIASIELQKD